MTSNSNSMFFIQSRKGINKNVSTKRFNINEKSEKTLTYKYMFTNTSMYHTVSLFLSLFPSNIIIVKY